MKKKENQSNRKYNSIVDNYLQCKFEDVEKEYGIKYDSSELIMMLNTLDITDRRLLILYAELGSFRKVAKIYNCSSQTIYKKIAEIRSKFKKIENIKYDCI